MCVADVRVTSRGLALKGVQRGRAEDVRLTERGRLTLTRVLPGARQALLLCAQSVSS